jgi:threonine/homoserine/homoserine lactone efflux protein
MLEIAWLFFLGASLVVIIAPGQNLALVMSRGVGQGRLAGIVTAAGVSSGLLGHTVLATFGVAAILRASGFAFILLKIVGALYLAYLDVRLILSAGHGLNARPAG